MDKKAKLHTLLRTSSLALTLPGLLGLLGLLGAFGPVALLGGSVGVSRGALAAGSAIMVA